MNLNEHDWFQGMSQGPGFAGLSQDSLAVGEFASQMDGLLSQDSTYQGDRSNFFHHSQGAQFSQVSWKKWIPIE